MQYRKVKTMKIRRGLISWAVMAVLLVAMLVPAAVWASAPILPTAFYGTVTVNGNPAPDGTVVTARIVNAVGSPGQGSLTVSGGSGQYGASGLACQA